MQKMHGTQLNAWRRVTANSQLKKLNGAIAERLFHMGPSEQWHRACFNEEHLKWCLYKAGFSNCKRITKEGGEIDHGVINLGMAAVKKSREPDAFAYQALYDRLRASGYHEEEDGSSHLATYIPWLKERLNYESVLDIGCSAGGSLPLLGSDGETAYGVDVSAVAVTKGRRLGRNVFQASATALPFSDNEFDLVVSADVFEHLHPDDAEKAASEAIRVARRFVFMKIAHHEDATVKWKELAGHPLHLTTEPLSWWLQFFRPAGEIIWHAQFAFCLRLPDAAS